MLTTDAWVLQKGSTSGGAPRDRKDVLAREKYPIGELAQTEVLVEPLYGSWEANMDHALAREPIDLCEARGEDAVIVGNLGVVRVLRTGSSPRAGAFKEGDICMVMPFGRRDRYGYAELIYAYDMPGTIGLLAKQTKVDEDMLLPVPDNSMHMLPQWAAYARYFTAWDNWRTALTCWRAQMPEQDAGDHLVFAWGGGVAFAEVQLAQRAGFRVAMTASSDERLEFLRKYGITAVDRRLFPNLAAWPGDEGRYQLAKGYGTSERSFLRVVRDLSDGAGVAIFIDNIGAPLYKATLKALARQGVLATCGWKRGMNTGNRRASECIKRHLHVHTHVWRSLDSAAIRDYQEREGWIAPIDRAVIYQFDDVPQLAEDYATGRLNTYFPLYQVNQV